MTTRSAPPTTQLKSYVDSAGRLLSEAVRADFPVLERPVRGHPLVYFDSAASSLKPRAVADRMHAYYLYEASNVHRGAHYLSEQGTISYEAARTTVAQFLGCKSDEVIFTRGTTESINLVASSYGDQNLVAGDEIVLSELEHHSNIVPWQQLAMRTGARLKVAPITDDTEFDLEAYRRLLSSKTKIVAITWVSNATGSITPIKEIIRAARSVGAVVMVDAAQAATCMKIDVREIDCDFLAFSGHKVFGPYGTGALYGRSELLEAMSPYQTGGSMISEVTWDHTTWAAVPHKFEAGTPHISGAIGLAAAIRYINEIGLDTIHTHERRLMLSTLDMLASEDRVTVIGHVNRGGAPIVSLNIDGVHASDVGALLDQQGIAVRAGHHCCQPLMRRLKVPATVRVALSIYNTPAEIAALKLGLQKAKDILL